MKSSKRWLYLANDLTNSLLGQSPDKNKQLISKLKTWLTVIAILLLLSLLFNLYTFLNS